jgi:ATP-dependent Clp protease ATP-binding subunit ClpB
MLMQVLTQQFRPEFLNRVDETVVFHPLDHAQIKNIAGIQLNRLRQRLAERQYGLEVSEAALEHIAAVGFDPVFGARPLKRAVQQYVENALAQSLLRGNIPPNSLIHIDVVADKFIISSQPMN